VNGRATMRRSRVHHRGSPERTCVVGDKGKKDKDKADKQKKKKDRASDKKKKDRQPQPVS
jgi:hypothetical protein